MPSWVRILPEKGSFKWSLSKSCKTRGVKLNTVFTVSLNHTGLIISWLHRFKIIRPFGIPGNSRKNSWPYFFALCLTLHDCMTDDLILLNVQPLVIWNYKWPNWKPMTKYRHLRNSCQCCWCRWTSCRCWCSCSYLRNSCNKGSAEKPRNLYDACEMFAVQ